MAMCRSSSFLALSALIRISRRKRFTSRPAAHLADIPVTLRRLSASGAGVVLLPAELVPRSEPPGDGIGGSSHV